MWGNLEIRFFSTDELGFELLLKVFMKILVFDIEYGVSNSLVISEYMVGKIFFN